MSWIIEGDTAIYRVKNFCIVKKIKIVEVAEGNYVLRDKIVYIDDIKTIAATNSYHKANEEYREALKDPLKKKFLPNKTQALMLEMNDKTIKPINKENIGIFSDFIFRECVWCGTEFKKTASDRVVCKGKCRTAMSRARENVREAVIEKSNKGVCVVFPNGSVCMEDEYDTVSYRGNRCKIFSSFHKGTSSIRDRAEWVFYFEEKDDLYTVCDIGGEMLPRQLILIYKEAVKLKDMEKLS